MAKDKFLKWRFDVNTFKLLGRELITDRITALFELVKNSYDANAEEVFVEFHNVKSINKDSKIIIRDNGKGMSFNDLKNGWMVVGTNNKRIHKITEEPYFRKIIGEKGIGRFAVDKLGSKLQLLTKPLKSSVWFDLEINWNTYEKLSNKNSKKYFTEIPNKISYKSGNKEDKGTQLIITDINEIWSNDDITRAYKELSKLISPLKKIKPPFNIFITSNEYKDYELKEVKNESIKYASESIQLYFDKKTGKQEIVKNYNGQLIKSKIDQKVFGPINFHLFYFDQYAKASFRKAYKGGNLEIDGVKIYRDDIITTPFAEYEDKQDNKRDILGIDKRRWSGFFDKVSSRDLIGIVEITKAENPLIKDNTNRQDFVDNQEYRELKEYIIEQIAELEKYLKHKKEQEREKVSKNLNTAQEDFSVFYEELNTIEKENPKLAVKIKPLKKKAREIQINIKKGIKTQVELQKEAIRKENLYLSLMSLQEYAAEIAHLIRTSLSNIKSQAEYFNDNFPDDSLNEYFILYAKEIYSEMSKLDIAMDFMLSYAKSNIGIEEFNIKDVIENVFKQFSIMLNKEDIRTLIEIDSSFLLTHNRKFIEDIFANLISNSIKALKHTTKKLIKCSAYVDNNKFIIIFSDNGEGIPEKNREKVFEVYFTTTAEDGGGGIGLYTVKKRIDALKGDIKVVNSELDNGATFRIELPFNK